MVKQHIKKQSNNLGHNNPPEVLRIEFKNKIDENIYRAKKFLLKKNGHWD